MVCGLFPSPTRWRPKRSSSSLRVASASMMYPRRGPFWSEADYLGGKVGLNDPLLPPYPRSISHNSQDNVHYSESLGKAAKCPLWATYEVSFEGGAGGPRYAWHIKKNSPTSLCATVGTGNDRTSSDLQSPHASSPLSRNPSPQGLHGDDAPIMAYQGSFGRERPANHTLSFSARTTLMLIPSSIDKERLTRNRVFITSPCP